MNELTRHTEMCQKKVSDHTGFRFWICGKPAKFRVSFDGGPAKLYCGIHANAARRRLDTAVIPLSDEVVSK